ncbi:MAG: hypothetical protein RL653_981 [Pseudomonadota bacterium]
MEERCDGTALQCPADGAQPDGTSCRADTVGNWGPCILPSTCIGTGERTRVLTGFACQAGACLGTDRTETEVCTANQAGAPCGTPAYGAWSACSFPSTCAETGSRTRTVTRFSCTAGSCSNPQTTTETGTCVRSTEGTGCGTTQYGAWSGCTYAGTCDETAPARARSVTTFTCQAGTCARTTGTELGQCIRNTDGTACAAFSYGSWSACGSFASTCDESGTQSRSVTGKKCSAGACVGFSGTDRRNCSRDTDGTSCGRNGCNDSCSNGTCVYRCLQKKGCRTC